MRSVLALLVVIGAATAAHGADKTNVCPEGPATVTGTIGSNRLFDPPEYWIEKSEPCGVHVIELAAPDAACEKGAKFSATGTIEHIRNDGELSLVRLIKPDKASCGK